MITRCCITCKDPAVRSCGLCSSCYQAAMRAIREGRITRIEAERRGLILPPRNASNPWTQRLANPRKDSPCSFSPAS